jgi:phosphatidylglycerol lysyltransferase
VSDRARAFELVRRFGRETVAFQGLESGYRYFFDGDDAVVPFVDTGSSWVAAGSPIAPPDRVIAVAREFSEAALAQRRRACFFASERTLGGPALQIGEQPVWTCAQWSEVLRSSPSLRYQLRRATHKDVVVRPLRPDEHAALDVLVRSWQSIHRMPPMQFLVQLEPFAFAHERVNYVAERGGQLVGLVSAVPVYARERLFVEDLVRAPEAPNGTVELMVDAMMRGTSRELTLGLAPLAGNVAMWLRFARWAGAPFYDFDGLRRFKTKLRPHAWEPVYLATAAGGSRVAALRDSLRAFAGGSLVGFAARTLFRQRQ